MSANTGDVFICYAAADEAAAQSVCSALEAEGVSCWIAPRDVVPGYSYARAIIEAIATSKLLVLVLSSDANRSPHVMRELERATSRDVPILPYRIEDVVPSPALEYFISSSNWLDSVGHTLEETLPLLTTAVQMLLERVATPGADELETAPVAAELLQPPQALPTTPAETTERAPAVDLPSEPIESVGSDEPDARLDVGPVTLPGPAPPHEAPPAEVVSAPRPPPPRAPPGSWLQRLPGGPWL
ncbi:MAG: toll/interleukin-1 receptor domain-containing protein, partial [Nitriliruptorales bacterium]|nr:toll/interleukin-1 receptor domain-containing protein [Nitriliruptorales bacterium]